MIDDFNFNKSLIGVIPRCCVCKEPCRRENSNQPLFYIHFHNRKAVCNKCYIILYDDDKDDLIPCFLI